MPFDRDGYLEEQRSRIRTLEAENVRLRDGRELAEMAERLADRQSASRYWKEKADSYHDSLKRLRIENGNLKEKLRIATKARTRLEKELADAKAMIAELETKVAVADAERDDAKEENRKLKASLSKDSGNSSVPTSKERPGCRHIQNNRGKSDRKPGAQKGHKGHARVVPHGDIRRTVELMIDDGRVAKEGLVPTGKVVEKHVVGVTASIVVTTYRAHLYRTAGGKTVHAPFPQEVGHNEVNYSPSLKALLYQLMVACNVSVRNAGEFISGITEGRLRPSDGFIHSLMGEFAGKATPELRNIFANLSLADEMHVDFTNASLNGKARQVLVCCNDDNTLYLFRDHKGHEGVKGSPLEISKGLIHHDHDLTFYSYGSRHQECLVHIRRYLKGAMELEPDRQWAKDMLKLFDEFFLLDGQQRSQMTDPMRHELEERYSSILENGMEDYSQNPPSKWIRDGYNLCRRLLKYKDDCLLFLHDPKIAKDNNAAELRCRTFKRKLGQMTTFRSKEGGDNLCAGLSVLMTLKSRKAQTAKTMEEIFGRPPVPKSRIMAEDASSQPG